MQPCLFCSGDASAPDHAARCDGRQGRIEAGGSLAGMVRAGDPDTCVEAAAVIEPRRSALQAEVISAFAARGTLTDRELETYPGFERYAYSTVRKRRTELYQQGVLEIVGERRNERNRKMLVFALKERSA